jgi:hypothetical protein
MNPVKKLRELYYARKEKAKRDRELNKAVWDGFSKMVGKIPDGQVTDVKIVGFDEVTEKCSFCDDDCTDKKSCDCDCHYVGIGSVRYVSSTGDKVDE